MFFLIFDFFIDKMAQSRRQSKKVAPEKKKPVTSQVKAGLKFPVSRIGRMMKRDRIAGMVGK